MKNIRFARSEGNGFFYSTNYDVDSFFGTHKEAVRLCASASTRLFKLTPGAHSCIAVVTKVKPRKCEKYYEIVDDPRSYYSYHGRKSFKLKGYKGGFMGGVGQALAQLHAEGYRYVRLENDE